jgi:hypothetical protein
VDDVTKPDAQALHPFEGTIVALHANGDASSVGCRQRPGAHLPGRPERERDMRWPAKAEAKRMLQDLTRLLKASQIG